MKQFMIFAAMAALAVLSSCGPASKETKDTGSAIQTVENNPADTVVAADTMTSTIAEVAEVDHSADIELIRTVYKKIVFGDSYKGAKKYFTAKALKKLAADYEYDCVGSDCYAFWALRTDNQDGSGSSKIISIESDEDGWYVVTYKDMGHDGVTRIKVADGKIDDYIRVKG